MADNADYGIITGRFAERSTDTNDVDRRPQYKPWVGLKLVFVPEVARPQLFRDLTAGDEETFTMSAFVATTDDAGYVVSLLDTATRGMPLPSSVSPKIDPSGWTWRVRVFSDDSTTLPNGVAFPEVEFSFLLGVDEEKDLTTLVPVPPNPGAELVDWEAAVARAEAASAAAEEAAAAAAAFGTTNEEIVSSIVTAQIANPETPANSAVVDVVVDALDGFTLGSVPMLVNHGDNAGFARPVTERPVWWQGTVNPLNRIAGDSVFLVEAVPVDEVIAADYFNRSDGALGSTPIGAKAWTVFGTGAAAAVVSNRLAFTALTSGNGYVYFDSGTAAGRVTAKFATMSAGHIGGVAVRYVDANNHILLACRVSSTDYHYRLIKRISGTATVLADFDVVSTAGDVARIDLNGTAVTVAINGVQKYAGTVSEFVTATRVGAYTSSAELATTYDDFSVIIPA